MVIKQKFRFSVMVVGNWSRIGGFRRFEVDKCDGGGSLAQIVLN